MKLSRLVLISATFLFGACSLLHPWPQLYRRVRVTNPRGELVADWIAEGRVFRTEFGYRFRAVQRTSPPPYMLETHYPNGRVVEVTGPNIVVAPAGKPLWLCELQGY